MILVFLFQLDNAENRSNWR